MKLINMRIIAISRLLVCMHLQYILIHNLYLSIKTEN